MRKIAFGYSTHCNIKCSHCVASGESHDNRKMELERAKEVLVELALAGVRGVSFTAGEPFLFFEDLLELVALCKKLQMYTRVVTNCSWAESPKIANGKIGELKVSGISQVRMSSSRWHHEHVPHQNLLNASNACASFGIDSFISFVTDFSVKDESHEKFLRDNGLKFFPEPLIYDGRAKKFKRSDILTDYQENRCFMNAYLAPDLNMYACCDAGSHFTATNFFHLGNMNDNKPEHLFNTYENDTLYKSIQTLGLTAIAAYMGMSSRQIVSYRKCELCCKLFNCPDTVRKLRSVHVGDIVERWKR